MILPRNRHIGRQFTQLFALIAITFAAYFPVLHNGFIWDDDRYIENNSHLRTLQGLRQIWLQPLKAEPQYYPLTHTTLWTEYHLWKLNPTGYHFDNLLLHAASAVLLWRILLRLKVPGALLAATIFAIHPLQVESVAWATERKNVLSGLFYFLSLSAYLRTRWCGRIWDSRERREIGWAWYALSLLLFVAALLSKSVASTLPAVILVVLWWKRGKIQVRDFYPLIPMLIAGLAMGVLTGWMEKHVVGAIGANFDSLTPVDRICIAGRAIWFYLGKLIWPSPLVFIYPQWHVDPAVRQWWILFPLSACGAIVACWLLRKKIGRGPIVAMLLFAGTLVPALGFVNVFPMQFSYVADHFQYLACIAPITLMVAGILRIGHSWRRPGYSSGALCAVIAALCIVTNLRTHVYLNRETLWGDTVTKNPNAPMAHNNYAAALRSAGHIEAAKTEYRIAMKLRNDPIDWIGLGQCDAIDGDYLGARDLYAKAIDATPDSNEPVFRHYKAGWEFQLGTAYQALAGKYPDKASEYFARAEEAYKKAIELYPEYEDPHTNLSSIFVDQKRYSEAIGLCRAVLTENPESFSAHMNMGRAFYAEGQLDSALAEYQAALELQPDNANAMASVGSILAQQGQIDRGIAMLQAALKIDPQNPIAMQSLAAAMARKTR